MYLTGSKAGDVVAGVGTILLGHACTTGLASVLGKLWGRGDELLAIMVLLIGVTQLVYVLPVAIVSRKKGYSTLAWGCIGAAAITALCNGACWAAVGGMSF